jgi:hypothetical protein
MFATPADNNQCFLSPHQIPKRVTLPPAPGRSDSPAAFHVVPSSVEVPAFGLPGAFGSGCGAEFLLGHRSRRAAPALSGQSHPAVRRKLPGHYLRERLRCTQCRYTFASCMQLRRRQMSDAARREQCDANAISEITHLLGVHGHRPQQ